ncbi:MAG TPA: hypothetical protein VIK78_11795 [Ruminiclostridium sp.]
MKQRSNIILGIYDLILASGAIFSGFLMLSSSKGIFSEYPTEWLSILPFKSWIIPGIIAISLFGVGNIVAAIFSFRRKNNKSWFASSLMGGILLISLVCQVIILGEWYLATMEFLILSIVQLCLSGFALLVMERQNG